MILELLVFFTTGYISIQMLYRLGRLILNHCYVDVQSTEL